MDSSRETNFDKDATEIQFDNAESEGYRWNNPDGMKIESKVVMFVNSQFQEFEIDCHCGCEDGIVRETLLRLNKRLRQSDKDEVRSPFDYAIKIARSLCIKHSKKCLTYNNKLHSLPENPEITDEVILERELELFNQLRKFPQTEMLYILSILVKEFKSQVDFQQKQIFYWWHELGYNDREIWEQIKINEPSLTSDACKKRRERVTEKFMEFCSDELPQKPLYKKPLEN